ncbi:MAG: sigma-70 family RNA polymerase sigma factor [Anaerolineales bacterium]|nr:sigma-70 family RNA polymerase sigma factor [Anaerolineales bacterium]
MDEVELLRLAQRGDLEAFNRVVLEHQTRAFNVALRVLGDGEAAADATQDAFLSAYRNLRSYRGGSFRAWLLRIVTNACYDELRRRKRRPATSLEELGPETEDGESEVEAWLASTADGPERLSERTELVHAIQDCLDRLPDEFRIVAVLADVQGYNYDEVSSAIGKPLGTVKSRLARARARLRDCLQRHGELLPAAFRLHGEASS